MRDTVHVRTDNPIGRIAPDIYGHFAEHLGRCIYGGIWVGEDDRVPTDDGIRTDTVSLLQDLDMPVLRWPGGCFADDYHWEDGIGPREERPRRRNHWWTQGRENVPEEPNTFGTEEFLRLCRMLDAEPYLAANVGTGSPDEMLDWVEYCNYHGDTEYADKRRENGSEEPHGVRYWGVGNENWGCGGRFDPDEYGREYRRFANYLRSYDRTMSPDEDLELVACGHTTEDWNREFLNALGETGSLGGRSPYTMIDHLSVHRYYDSGDDTDFTDEQYYRLFAKAQQVARDVDDAVDVIESFAPGTDIGVIVDEWGVWHPQATARNGLEQENTVRDALTAAGVFDDFNARADVITMANIAQTVNVLQCLVQTDEEDAWPTPTYQVFDLYKPHMGATALRTAVSTEEHVVENEDGDVPMVSASASETDDGLYVTASNRDLDTTREVELAFDDIDLASAESVTAEVLFADLDPDQHSTADNADEFTASTIDVAVEDGSVVADVPPSSAVGVTVQL